MVGTADEEAGKTVDKKDDKKDGKKAPSKSVSRMNMFAPKTAPPTAILTPLTYHPVAAKESQNLSQPSAPSTAAPGAGIMDSLKGIFSPTPSDDGSVVRPDLQA